MKKKIILNSVGIIMTMAMLTTMSFALFTSTNSITGNSLTNGTVLTKVFDIDSGNAVTPFGQGQPSFLNIDGFALQSPNNEANLAVGDTVKRVITVENTGTLDQFFRIYIAGLSSSNTTVENPYQYYKVTVLGINGNSTMVDSDCIKNGTVIRTNVPLDQFNVSNPVAGLLTANTSTKVWYALGISQYVIEITLDSNAPSDVQAALQGAKINFTIQTDAVQVANNIDTTGLNGLSYNLSSTNINSIHW